MQSIAQSIEQIGVLSGRISPKDEVRHFTDSDYRKIADAIFKEMTNEDYETIIIEDVVPKVDITVRHWTSGYWDTGGSDDWGRTERIWTPTKHEFEVDSFEMVDKGGYDITNDFDKSRLELMLNQVRF